MWWGGGGGGGVGDGVAEGAAEMREMDGGPKSKFYVYLKIG
jgi:hypothetical protein